MAPEGYGRPPCLWLGVLLTALAFMVGCGTPRNGGRVDYGPFYSRDTALDGSTRIRAAGPFYEHQTHPDGMTFEAIRPLWSAVSDPRNNRRLDEVLWPVATRRTSRGQLYWRILLAYGLDYDAENAGSRYRSGLFPFFFWGRDKEGLDYFAFFPLWGTLREFLGFDRIHFALFPLYARAYDRDNVTTSILWPVFSTTRGDNVARFRIFPLYGYSERPEQWRKTFILWPFWTMSTYYDGAGESGFAWMLFPLFGRVNLQNQSSTLIFPPFFRFSSGTKESGFTCPWPFVQARDGQAKSFFLWPLWGWKEMEGRRTTFFLWPIGSTEQLERPWTSIRRFDIFPFFSRETRRPKGELRTGATDAYLLRLWPVFSTERRGDVLERKAPVLWPASRMQAIERNYAPLWTLYRSQQQGLAFEEELLWGVWRYRREAHGDTYSSLFPLLSWQQSKSTEGRKGWSLLRGLLSYAEQGDQQRLRLLYFLDFGSLPDQ